jgi:hypothetical protein
VARYSWPRIATATEAVYRDVLRGRDVPVDVEVDHAADVGADMVGAHADGGIR